MSSEVKLILLQQEDITPITTIFSFPWTTSEATREKWDRYLSEQQSNIRKVCLAKIGNEIIGYGSLLKKSEYPSFQKLAIPEIHDVWISEKYRGNGYGRTLIEFLESIARNEKHKEVGIGVGLYKDYGFAQKLYVRMGYIPDGNGITYKYQTVTPGITYPVDDDLIIWFKKELG